LAIICNGFIGLFTFLVVTKYIVTRLHHNLIGIEGSVMNTKSEDYKVS